MHLDNLRYFYEVAQAKSISNVARYSHISQSALSQQLQKLEENFNTKLFIRSNKGVSLTKEGQIVYNHCEAILNTYNKMIEELENISNNNSLVTIDGIDILTSTFIPIIIPKLHKFFPNYKMKIISTESNSNTLITNNSDINISYTHYHDNLNIITKDLYEDKLIFIAHNSFKKDSLTLNQFMNTPLILISDKINIKNRLSKCLNLYEKDFYSLPIAFTTNMYSSAIVGINKNPNMITCIPLSIYNAYYKDLGIKEVTIKELDMPLTMYISFTEQLYKREKYFLDKFTSILKSIF